MIRDLTKKYVKVFDARNLGEILAMVTEDVFLSDPDNVVYNKDELKALLEKIFSNFKKLSFKARNIVVEGNNSVIEFELQLDDLKLVGTDFIEWQGNKIKALRAYLYKAN